ncbi:phosphoketolase family protein, partial [Streptomyces sp. NRRL S-146]|uniref:phosphoketolase family protein n=1 Tax=Streptomyces sp. NRRL S-146 TaxID=1463884 RepID=UPI000559E746
MPEAPRQDSRTGTRTAPTDEELRTLDAHWRAANYLAAGQIYLLANPLLAEPLRPEHIKPRLLGHWGTSPGLNLVHTHLNRVIKARDLDALCIWGPGHGGPSVLANSWLEGSYSEKYPNASRDAQGMELLMRQFSFPGGVPSHVAPEVPGSIHEGGELGYSLAHAYGAALDNPGLLVACVIGDGEAETGPLAGSWHANKFLDPVHDGAVLPILHLNGYKIANPTVLARLPEEELDALLRGYGHEPIHVTGDDPATVHRAMAEAMDTALDRIAAAQRAAREDGVTDRPHWPVIVLRTPKGWTGPAEVDGEPVEGTWRAHQVPLSGVRDNPDHLRQLESWLRSYRPEELFDAEGRPVADVLACVPDGTRRLGATPYANGGLLVRDLPIPSLDQFAVPVDKPGTTLHEPTRVLGDLLARVMSDTADRRDFRLVGPDETASNRLQAVYGASGKAWQAETLPVDEHLDRHGRVMEILSEHLCQGWLEGYLLTGRHGLFSCYEAFVHIVDSMVNHHVWRQDHNGFSHQDPGFVDHVLNKSPEVVRVYL